MTTSQRKTDAIDDLYQLPLADFTAARNALSSRLKKEGKKEEAEQVKSLAKPSISAWAINQLFWSHRKVFDRLMASGEQLRRAQSSQLAGKATDLRKPLEARREALTELSRTAAKVLTGGGHAATPDMMRRITSTLEALSTLGSGGPQPGRLADDVDPPGFETLASLVPSAGGSRGTAGGQSTVLPFAHKPKPAAKAKAAQSDEERAKQEAAERAEAKAAVQEAERALREARATAERAEAALKKAAAETKAAEQARADAEKALEKATERASQARLAARRVAAEAEEAAGAVVDAERALEKARERL
jgi:hypothetical protein